jgi:type 1 glutamine amidotransferase
MSLSRQSRQLDRDDPAASFKNGRADGGKSFYTSLGHRDDFSEPAFRKLLVAALHWVTQRDHAE